MSAQIVQFRESAEAEEPREQPVKINLGCNQNPIKGYINVDIYPFPGVDVVADLEKPWVWPDNHADLIQCADLPEHIRMWWDEPCEETLRSAELAISLGDMRAGLLKIIAAMREPRRTYGIIHFMNEAHRVLKLGGILDMLIPSSDARGWAQDPTHVSYWNENSILYFTDQGYRGLYPHLIKARFKPIKVVTTVKNPMDISWVHAILEKV